MGVMFLPEDRVLLEDTLVSLNVDDAVIGEIRKLLSNQEIAIETHPPHDVRDGWFGGSFTGGTRLAVNATRASGVVESEMKNLVYALREYREIIDLYADDMVTTDESIVSANRSTQNALDCSDLTPTTACVAPAEGS